MCVRHLKSGDSQASLSYLFRIANQTISNTVLETTAAIWFGLEHDVFEPLSPDFWLRKYSEFEQMWNFPMCGGAMDGRHCFVQVGYVNGCSAECGTVYIIEINEVMCI